MCPAAAGGGALRKNHAFCSKLRWAGQAPGSSGVRPAMRNWSRSTAESRSRQTRHMDVPRRRRWRSFGQKPRFLPKTALGRAGCPDPAPSNNGSATGVAPHLSRERRAGPSAIRPLQVQSPLSGFVPTRARCHSISSLSPRGCNSPAARSGACALSPQSSRSPAAAAACSLACALPARVSSRLQVAASAASGGP
jgi:hypothetical protein